MDIFPPAKQRPALLAFAEALDSRVSALRRDECSDWRINGKQGHIYATPEGFQLCYFARCGVTDWDGEGPHIEDYTRAKRYLAFCCLSQDGTGEGIFFLDRIPNETEATAIRDVFGILRRVQYSEEQLAAMRERARGLRNRLETTTSGDIHPQDRA
jgi:hypothetical protein